MPLAIIIIGAGAAGLLAARELSAAGFTVTLLEAAGTPGGRMRTMQENGFTGPVEAGAEFIHGELELSLRLARQAGITLHPVRAAMVRVRKGKWSGNPMQAEGGAPTETEGWDLLMQKMAALEADQPIAKFLAKEFPGDKYAALRDSVRGFAEGYDLADMDRASTKALYKEWSHEDDEEEYRLEGGYRRLVEYLVAQCQANGCTIRLSTPATHIRWEEGRVEVTAATGAVFTANRLVVAVPLSVLQADPAAVPASPPPPGLHFFPPIPDYRQAACQLGYGSVIKILLEFKTPFWNKKKKPGHTLFILSDEPVPTWWTQPADTNTLLTGWLTGDNRRAFQKLTAAGRLDACLSAVASIFAVDPSFLREQLTASRILDWSTAPYIAGGYSFEAINGDEARAILSEPVAQTLYFAGEALYEGAAPSTVEAALCSGRRAAQKIIAQS